MHPAAPDDPDAAGAAGVRFASTSRLGTTCSLDETSRGEASQAEPGRADLLRSRALSSREMAEFRRRCDAAGWEHSERILKAMRYELGYDSDLTRSLRRVDVSGGQRSGYPQEPGRDLRRARLVTPPNRCDRRPFNGESHPMRGMRLMLTAISSISTLSWLLLIGIPGFLLLVASHFVSLESPWNWIVFISLLAVATALIVEVADWAITRLRR